MRCGRLLGVRPVHVLALLCAVAAAVAGARAIAFDPRIALVVPALLAASAVARLAPGVIAVGLVAVAGISGSLFAFTSINAQGPADALLAALWLAAAWSLLLEGGPRERRIVWPSVALLALFLSVSVVAIVTAPTVADGVRSFRGSHWLMTAALLPLLAPWDTEIRRTIFRGVVLVGLAVGAYACFRYASGAPAPDELAAATRADAGFRRTPEAERAVIGTFTSPKTLGLWCAIVMPPAFAAALAERGAWRLIGALAGTACAVAVFGSQTRTALIGAIVGLVLVIALHVLSGARRGPRFGRSVTALVVAAAALLGGFGIAASENVGTAERFAELRSPTEVETYQIRRDRWEQALSNLDDQPLGSGLATASVVARERGRFADEIVNIDSSYVKIAVEQGVQVVAFLVAILLLFVHLAFRAARTSDPDGALWGIAACGTLAAFAVLMYGTIAAEQLPAVVAWLVCGLAIAQLARVPAEP